MNLRSKFQVMLALSFLIVASFSACSSQPNQSQISGQTEQTQQGIQVGLTIYNSGQAMPAQPTQQTQQILPSVPPQDAKVTVLTPDLSKPLKNPIFINGEVSGVFFFEGTFPVLLEDNSGKILARSQAHAEGDWMTDAQVPFTVQFTLHPPYPVSAILSFQKDNASGFTQYEQDFRVTLK